MAQTRTRSKGNGKKNDYGLLIVGKMRIFSKERTVKSKGEKYNFVDYSITISRKKEDDTWYNHYIPCFFPKDMDRPENNSIIAIQDSTLFITGNEGYEKLSLFIRKWDYAE